MVELYKMDCNGNWYFCDYGLITKTEDYKLRGYIVRRAVPNTQRRAMPQRGRIDVVHRVKKVGFVERFVNDCKHNVKIFKEIGDMFFGGFKTKRSKAKDAAMYFASKAAMVAA